MLKAASWKAQVPRLQKRLGVKPERFRTLMGGVDSSTVYHWRKGTRNPHPSAQVLIMLLSNRPELYDDILQAAIDAGNLK